MRVTDQHGMTHEIRAPVVVSNAGLHNTFRKLVPEEIGRTSPLYDIQADMIPSQSMVLAFVGFNKSSEELGLKKETIWAFGHNDAGVTSDAYINGSLENALNSDVPEFAVSFSSTKDPDWDSRPECEGKATCTMGVGANYEWFKKFSHLPAGNRGPEYKAIKSNIGGKLVEAFCRVYPHLREHISCVKVCTPLSKQSIVRVSTRQFQLII